MSLAAILLALMLNADADPPVDPGKAAYVRGQCDFCHGPGGMGAMGPGLVPFAKSPGYLLLVVRRGIGLMPSHTPDIVSDADVRAIYQFLRRVESPAAPRKSRIRPRASPNRR
jgi:mono/diheme cytochrome c family protein